MDKDRLATYRRKRRSERTPEPASGGHSATPCIFVIDKHDAATLPYDLRLAIGGVLKS